MLDQILRLLNQLYKILNLKKDKIYSFTGNKGNTGMFCGINKLSGIPKIDLYGASDGFEGYKGFALIYLKGKWARK